jgi:hypothetical protein
MENNNSIINEDHFEYTKKDINLISEKKIIINGTSNRYQIKKLMKTPLEIKKRKEMNKINIPVEYFFIEKQNEIVIELNEYMKSGKVTNCEDTKYNYFNFIKMQIENKLSSYKQQDKLKKRLDNCKFIKIETVIEKMGICNMKCYYCNDIILLLYENVRDEKQWTLDRINNDLGHNIDNVVISCLQCNLKRRRTGKDAFLFTKQLKIVKI